MIIADRNNIFTSLDGQNKYALQPTGQEQLTKGTTPETEKSHNSKLRSQYENFPSI